MGSLKIFALFFCFFSTACTYSGKVINGFTNSMPIVDNREGITLINNPINIVNPTIFIGAFTLNYDIQESFLKGVAESLRSGFSRIDIARAPEKSNSYYAIPYLDAKQLYHTGHSSGLVLTTRVEVYETASSRLVQVFARQTPIDYIRPDSVTALALFTAAFALLPLPITHSMALEKCGEHGMNLIESAMKSSLVEISGEMSLGLRISPEKPPVENRPMGIESLLKN